jgi:hypothetical protein
MEIRLDRKLEQALDAYRAKRHAETGKRPMREGAVRELLRAALNGVEPPAPLADRIAHLETRVLSLEHEVFENAVAGDGANWQ